MMYFKVEERPHHIHLKFYAPQSANAFSLEAARELDEIRRSLKAWTGPVVMSSEHPSVFCSGGNLSDYKKLKGRSPGLKINREIARKLDQFQKWPVVKLAVIDGDVFGGGMEWLARFDVRWTTAASMFSFWQRRIGLSTGWGGGRAWAEKLGGDRLKPLLLEARLICAHEALQLGLADRIVCNWQIENEIEVWVRRMHSASVPPLLQWSADQETKVFERLWMGLEHTAALKRWKG